MKDSIIRFIDQIIDDNKDVFNKIDNNALYNQDKVLSAFISNKISTVNFYPSTGYGYDDLGREKLGRVFADIFHTEDAIVSPHIMSGTHAISISLLGLLHPGDDVLAITGQPYDTIWSVINSNNIASLKNNNITFNFINCIDNYDLLEDYLTKKQPKMIYIQRSRGYSWRSALSIETIEKFVKIVRKYSKSSIIFADNCYGEFMEKLEPTDVGVDIIAGSLIKNPGAGIAPTGGYIAGKKELITQISYRYSAPCLGTEIGSYDASYRLYYQGIFMSPHVSAGALKGAYLVARTMEHFGYDVKPAKNDTLDDIVCMIKLKSKEELVKFCKAVQRTSPVDSFVKPEPADMPGYDNQVIMAAGTFIQGSSIELSADAPVVEPYIVYMQGGITFEHIKIALCNIIDELDLL